VHAGHSRGDRVAERALVLGERVAVQQDDGDRLGLGGGERRQDAVDPGVVERAHDPVGPGALGHRDAALGRRQGRRAGRAQPVQLRPCLAGELDEVGEALGGQQRGAGAAALEQGVRGHGHAVRERAHLARGAARALQRGRDGRHHALGLVARGGRRLGRHQAAVDGQDRVRERPADVDSEQHRPGTLTGPVCDTRPPGRRRPRVAGVPPATPRPARRAPPSPPGAGGSGSSRCAATACAGRRSPCASWRGTAAGSR